MLDPIESARGEREIRNAGLFVVGYYHSHPAGCLAPSEADFMSDLWPGEGPHWRLIVSPSGRVECYRLPAGRKDRALLNAAR